MAHHVYTTPGFVLGSRNAGEANKYLYLFTRDLGMIGVTAQAVRLEKSKLRQHIQDFSCATFSVVKGKEVWRITSALESDNLFDRIKISKENVRMYGRVLLLLKRLLAGEEKHEELFDLVFEGFNFLTCLDEEKAGTVRRNFEELMILRVLHLLGYIGNIVEFEPLLTPVWNEETVALVGSSRKKVVEHINRALKESQL